jgi:transposase
MHERRERRPTNWQEGRRLRALELHEQGWLSARIAEALGVTRGAVSQWLKRARDGGREALYHRKPPGGTARLTEAQRAQLPDLLAKGAEQYGFVGDVWTAPRVATVIRRTFGVRYHPASVSRLLRRIRWTPQKPIRRATQRKEEAVQQFREERMPSLQAKPRRRHAPSSGSMRPVSTNSRS